MMEKMESCPIRYGSKEGEEILDTHPTTANN